MKKKVFVCCAVLVVLGAAFAENAVPESPWDFSITTDFAYYPKSDTIPSAGGGGTFCAADRSVRRSEA